MHLRSAGAGCLSQRLFSCFLLLLASPLVGAFFPTDLREYWFGKGGKSHDAQTRDVLEALAVEFWPSLKTTGSTASMRKAFNTIVKANSEVDKDQKHSAKHFDGENFEGGQYVLTGNVPTDLNLIAGLDEKDGDQYDLIHKIQQHLAAGQPTLAREALGKALHTLQDFYAHTNYIELGYDTPHPDVGVPGRVITHVGSDVTTCGGACMTTTGNGCFCDPLYASVGLTSGYYMNEDRPPAEGDTLSPAPGTKCRHGGYLDVYMDNAEWVNELYEFVRSVLPSTSTNGINKDSFHCDWSPHGPVYHKKAVKVSKEASKNFIRYLKDNLITDKQLKLLFGLGPSLAFAIDTTGSMADIIASVSYQAQTLVSDRVGSNNEPILYVLVPFNDPDLGPIISTPDPDTFLAALSALGAEGGDDCPEPSMAGMLAALALVDEGSTLIVYTDASAKDSDLVSQVAIEAKAKGVTIYINEFASGCSGDVAYGTLANATGGVYSSLARSDVAATEGMLESLIQANLVRLLRVAGNPIAIGFGKINVPRDWRSQMLGRDTSTAVFTVPVDSSMTQVTFLLSGSATLSLSRPDGSIVVGADAGVTEVLLNPGGFITVKSPPPGEWQVSIAAQDVYTLSVTGVSTLQLSNLDFVEWGGRPGHQGLFNIDGSPTGGELAIVESRIDGAFLSANFEIRTPGGDLVQTLPLEQGSGVDGFAANNTFLGNFTMPNEPCMFYVTGQDAAGLKFQRMYSSVVTPISSNTTTNATTSLNTTSSVASSITTSTPYLLGNATSTTIPANTTTSAPYNITNATISTTSISANTTARTTSLAVTQPSNSSISTSRTSCSACTGGNYGKSAGPVGIAPGCSSRKRITTIEETSPVTHTFTTDGKQVTITSEILSAHVETQIVTPNLSNPTQSIGSNYQDWQPWPSSTVETTDSSVRSSASKLSFAPSASAADVSESPGAAWSATAPSGSVALASPAPTQPIDPATANGITTATPTVSTYRGEAVHINLDLSSLIASVGASFLAMLLYAFH